MPESLIGSVERTTRQPPNPSGWRYAALRLLHPIGHLPPARQFQVASFFVLMLGMGGTGWWLSRQIEDRVMWNTVTINTLYIESFVTPLLQDLDNVSTMTQPDIQSVNNILHHTSLGKQLAAFIIWGQNGHILYSSDPTQIGKTYVPHEDLRAALGGQVAWELVGATDEDHIPKQRMSQRLLAMYTPVRLGETNQVIAVAEFYQAFDPLELDIAATQRQTWLAIGGATLLMYLLLYGFVQQASDTIIRQESALSTQVVQLTTLLRQNDELHNRMQQATHRAATMNERLLRRISADLHDGPLQDLGAAILHFDRVSADYEQYPERAGSRHAAIVQRSLSQVIQEIRAICSGLGMPQLSASDTGSVIAHVVKSHEQRTGTKVQLEIQDLPEDSIPSIKVTLYRILQESLSNAARHGQGLGQRVVVSGSEEEITIQVSDCGPGFDTSQFYDTGDHLGLAGMRDRVESLGGRFEIRSALGKGTLLRVSLPLSSITDSDW
jgi:signal transduction histidine kinase